MDATPWYVELFHRDYYRGFVQRLHPEVTAREVEFVAQALASFPVPASTHTK